MAIDFKSLKEELLVAVRGSLSQGQLNKKLKFKSNQVYRWESGQTNISWKEFCSLCRATKRPIEDASRAGLILYDGADDIRPLIKRLVANGNQQQSAKKLGVSRSVISRWLNGRSDPTLEQVLQIAGILSLSLPTFLLTLVDMEALPSIKTEIDLEARERDLHFKYPWVGAVILCLRTPKYRGLKKHVEGFVTEHLGISLDEERIAIQELSEAKAISLGKDGLYSPRLTTISLTGNRDGNIALRKYWTKRCLEKLDGPRTGAPILWPYLVFNTDKKTYQKIFNKVQSLYHDIVALSDNDSIDDDEVYIFNMQLLDLRKPPESAD